MKSDYFEYLMDIYLDPIKWNDKRYKYKYDFIIGIMYEIDKKKGRVK